jgi:hypothetical protein
MDYTLLHFGDIQMPWNESNRMDEPSKDAYLFVCYSSWEMSLYGGESERKLARLQKPRI